MGYEQVENPFEMWLLGAVVMLALGALLEAIVKLINRIRR